MAVNDADDDADEEEPREVPMTTETRNVLRLLCNKVECSGGDQRLMRCVEQLENAFSDRTRTRNSCSTACDSSYGQTTLTRNGALFRELFLRRLLLCTRLVLAAAGELSPDCLAQLADESMT
ncbi:hypothetical protein HPB50_020816 [Hyalomma asiaticum]|uniref:Uncharacterized protein n=1 Tax=Hyalomma asiaticum TaxID=266040 RepID=A0ACB7SDV6_HYAAI|nr:hypothetical protein HPB50_020816 [Hyalomma asiaticum]